MLEFKKDFIEMEASNAETAYLKVITKYRILISKLFLFTAVLTSDISVWDFSYIHVSFLEQNVSFLAS